MQILPNSPLKKAKIASTVPKIALQFPVTKADARHRLAAVGNLGSTSSVTTSHQELRAFPQTHSQSSVDSWSPLRASDALGTLISELVVLFHLILTTIFHQVAIITMLHIRKLMCRENLLARSLKASKWQVWG